MCLLTAMQIKHFFLDLTSYCNEMRAANPQYVKTNLNGTSAIWYFCASTKLVDSAEIKASKTF